MKSAAVYVRISDDRGGAGLGVARQEEDCRKLADRLGWHVAGLYSDNDITAYTGKPRPAYQRLLDDLRSGTVNAVLAQHPDRLHRAPKELEEFIDVCEARGAAVQTVQAGTVDLSTPSGRAVARTLGAWARYESEHKAERQRRKHDELAESGAASGGGTRAFGLTRDRSAAVPEEAALIREAVERVLSGDSVRAIASDWNARGIATPTGGRWQQTPLRRMLMQARLTGYRERGGVLAGRGAWPAIITVDELQQVRARLSDPSRRTSTVNARRYLLAGLLTCHECGRRLVSRPRTDKVRRYVCAKGPQYAGCGKVAILAEPAEELVSAMVLEAIDSPALEAELQRRATGTTDAQVDGLREDEDALEQLSRDHYVDRIIGRPEFMAARPLLEERIASARRQLATRDGTSAIRGVVGSARKLWPAMSFDRRRALLSAVIEDVRVGPGRRGYNRFDATRLTPRWRY